ncbi:shikimate 5-dehydrogenase [Rhodococcus sp. BP-252]|uniref:shikimate 5-dehydrogenase n=1 Tax=unclassified Rhodococcus (in: high G+C Gram-positive bacteria) TaxID=192944 RepID=UPI001432148D|nr:MULTISPECIES: shikimate 5-dehydrogenase [unclassified Rhodococcus (in: high G+C Gram-positive bacteria)]MBY6413981.1 shikimate 5-dehydrogenase [Rhodococcus sp. BP-320]MBY6418786.1 shikimate 5-dehydrogenase [Rhodococcus sp. BP-321]MBY6423333.1 shikimate 5-dehydrogenase [Rhodococcus sp. BP-324]MBY6428821.1 shikimate 5-dehydrogenase [Rhodococcus sp. BP-323]MBY6433827.1 shikimate 5-dehydrogenase [Rhodococcus sp. BP-322]
MSRSFLNRETQFCMSLSGRPSNIGTRFHNYLYDELDLNFVYKAFTTTDLSAAIGGVRALGIRGCAVSMPFKEDVIALVDVMHDSASAIDSVNTIVNENGVLHAYNTDYQAVANLLASSGFATDWSVAVTGSGGMAKAVVAALRDSGFTDGTVVARNTDTGRALADAYGYAYSQDTVDADLLVNVTPIGMDGGPDADASPFSDDRISAAQAVFDVVAMPSETPLIVAARAAGKPVVTGAEVIALQAAEQFHLYTGVRPTDEQVRRASEFSRR